MSPNKTDSNASNPQQHNGSDNVSHALALYEKAKALSQYAKPLTPDIAKIIIVTAEDAIRGFGDTNQEKKIELKGMIDDAKELLPSETFDELKKRFEQKTLKKIHPKNKVLRNGLYVIVGLIVVGSTALGLFKSFAGRAESADTDPHPAPFTVQPTPMNPEVAYVPTPSPIPQEPTPSPTEMPQSSPTPIELKTPVPNNTTMWEKLTYGMEWRVTAIQPMAKATRFFIEIKNTDERREQSFYAFNRSPIVVVEKGGRFFQMVDSAPAPAGVKEENRKWYVQAGRTITVWVDFALLAKVSFSGIVLYQDQNYADPAKFTFLPQASGGN